MSKEKEAADLIKEILKRNNCVLLLGEEYNATETHVEKQYILYLHQVGESGQVLEPGVELIRGL